MPKCLYVVIVEGTCSIRFKNSPNQTQKETGYRNLEDVHNDI